jgi:C4-dicarboxylate-specific signal transduction histidine kinase
VKKSNEKAAFIGNVTASVTNEIQNVLAIIKETSGLMEDILQMNRAGSQSDIEDKFGSCLETIKKQAYRGVTLTSGLNGFAHTPDSTEGSINVFETIRKMISITDRLFKQKGVDVSIVECNKTYSIITDPLLFQMIVFSCIECLVDTFQGDIPITLDIQSLENRAAIKFSHHKIGLKHGDHKQQIIQSVQWIKICDLCNQIDLKAEVLDDIPGIFIFFK